MVTSVNPRSTLLRLVSCSILLDMTPSALAQSIQPPPPAYGATARQAGIPPDILFAIALQESAINVRGQRLPWPWTLNIAGTAHYFANQSEACRALLDALKHHSAKRIDVGLAQINLGYQKQFYRHPCELLIPNKNLAIAATLLRQHHRVGESWITTAGRYHRPAGGTPAARYRDRISVHMNQLASARSNRP